MESQLQSRNAWFRRAGFALAALPALPPLWVVLVYGVNMFYWDELNPGIAGLLLKAHDHTLTLADFFAQHNEHRIAVSRAIYLLVALLTHGNVKAIMLLQWPVVCLTSLGILWLMIQSNHPHREQPERWIEQLDGAVLFKWFISNLLIFSLVAGENWVESLGLVNVLAMAWIVAALVVVQSNLQPWTRTIIAIVLALLASYSVGSGLLCWPIAGAMLAWAPSRQQLQANMWRLIAWAAAFVVCITLYIHGYHSPPPPTDALEPSVLDRFFYFLVFLGNIGSYTYSTATMAWLGAVLALLYFLALAYFLHVWLRRRDYELAARLLLWLVIGGFTVANAALGGFFRVNRGVEQASSYRYVSYALYLSVALVMLVPMICQDLSDQALPANWIGRFISPRLWVQIPAFMAAPLIVAQVLGIDRMIDFFDGAHFERVHGRAALMLLNVAPDKDQLTQLVYPEMSTLTQMIPPLNALGYIYPPLMTSDNPLLLCDQSQANAPVAGHLDGITRSNDDPGILVAKGWAILPDAHEACHAVMLSYDDEHGQPHILAVSTNRRPRPDVVEATGYSQYLKSGWEAGIPIKNLPAEVHDVRILAWEVDTDHNKLLRLAGEFHVAH